MNFRFVRDKGFSLIEVLIAIAIFSIALLAINSLQVRNIKSGADSRSMTEAAYFANATMEDLIGQSYDTLADGNKEMDGCQISWNIVEDDLLDGTKTIRVIALFNFNEDASDGQPARIVLQRIVSR